MPLLPLTKGEVGYRVGDRYRAGEARLFPWLGALGSEAIRIFRQLKLGRDVVGFVLGRDSRPALGSSRIRRYGLRHPVQVFRYGLAG